MSATTRRIDAGIITLSYGGDFACCRLLCQSLDQYAPPDLVHQLFVPDKDIPLFSSVIKERRTIGSESQELLPFWLRKMPMPGPRLRRWLKLPRRNVYANFFGPPVRGWIAQQIMKISAAVNSQTEIVVHVDSDAVCIRPLSYDWLVKPGGLVRFYRHPEPVSQETHVLWREVACCLLGLDASKLNPGDYIDSCVVWRRSIVRRMVARIEEVGGTDWRKILARTPHFSEYTLYGMFVESLGAEAAGHFIDPLSPALSIWDDEPRTPEEEVAFVAGLKPHHTFCLIQSTMKMDFAKRVELLDRVKARAERIANLPV
jgi:hypothetical protein